MDTKHLQRHRLGWYLTLKVPAHAQELEGRKVIRQSLKTRDLREARATRDVLVGRYREEWSRLLEADPMPSSLDCLRRGADELRHRQRSGELDNETAGDIIGALLDQHLAARGIDPEHIDETAAREIRTAVAGASDPWTVSLAEAIGVYLRELRERVRPKSADQAERYLGMLTNHVGGSRSMTYLTSDAASSFINDVIMRMPVSTSTRRYALACVSAFAEWAVGRRYLKTSNPFAGLRKTIRAPTVGIVKDSDRRPYTVEEQIKLFTFTGAHVRDTPVWYVCALLFLTGARRQDVLNAKIEDVVRDGTAIRVTKAKNKASLRDIPLHSIGQALVKLLVGASSDQWLISGYPADKEGDRGDAIVKPFTRVRKIVVGVDANKGLDLHSWRHTFETTAARSGMDQRMLDAITGHAPPKSSTGRSVYFHEFEFEQKLAAVERLKIDERVVALLKAPPRPESTFRKASHTLTLTRSSNHWSVRSR